MHCAPLLHISSHFSAGEYFESREWPNAQIGDTHSKQDEINLRIALALSDFLLNTVSDATLRVTTM